MSREELSRLLEFIYVDVYPEGYSDIAEECALYREKCRRLVDDLIRALPPAANLLDLKELRETIHEG